MRPLALAATLVLAACAPTEPVDGTPDPVVDPTPAPTPTPSPTPAALTGSYKVTSQFDVPATVLAPGLLGESLGLLHQLSVNPAAGLLDLADAAGTPALGTLLLALPPSLESELEGWMNGYLDATTVDGTSPHSRIVALDAQVRSVLLDWDLQSTLDLPGSGAGTHTPIALVFSAAGEPIVVEVDATAPVTAATNVTGTVSWPAGGGSPRVAIGDHFMGVPFGYYAQTALDTLMQREYGAPGVAAALDAIVDCAALARSVAGRCVGPDFAPVCVGHEAELIAICEAGLDAATAQLEERIRAIDFEAIRFEAGAATVEGVAVEAGAGTASATGLSGGVWTSTIDLGNVPEAATATFTAAR